MFAVSVFLLTFCSFSFIVFKGGFPDVFFLFDFATEAHFSLRMYSGCCSLFVLVAANKIRMEIRAASEVQGDLWGVNP